MCGTFGQTELDFGEKYYRSAWKKPSAYKKAIKVLQEKSPNSYRVSQGSTGVMMRCPADEPEVQHAQFRWITKKKDGGTWPVFNVRSEGGWKNKDNDPNYKGPYQIFTNPYVKDIIFNQRCVVPVDYFVEQPENKKLKKKFVIRKQSREPFFLGGVYNYMVDTDSGEVTTHFAIITTAYTAITARADHKRSPLIIPGDLLDTYLDPTASEETVSAFFGPADSEGFECFEVGYGIAKQKDHLYEANDPRYIEPIGEVMLPEY